MEYAVLGSCGMPARLLGLDDAAPPIGWQGVAAHPDSPAGGGGPGYGKPPGPVPPPRNHSFIGDMFDRVGVLTHQGYESVADTTSSWYQDVKHTYLREQHVEAAMRQALLYTPHAIVEQTGFALYELAEGLLVSLIAMVVVLVVSSVGGGILGGAALGAISGGTLAEIGAVGGSRLGLRAGMWLLEKVGAAFLFIYIATKLHLVWQAAELGIAQAWRAGEGRQSEALDIDQAARAIAKSVGIFVGLIVQGIVLVIANETVGAVAGRLLVENERFAAGLAKASAKLRETKIGTGLAEFIEANAARLRGIYQRYLAEKGGGLREQTKTPQPPKPVPGEKTPKPAATTAGEVSGESKGSTSASEKVPAQAGPPKLRANLDAKWLDHSGNPEWPPNNGVAGSEQPGTLQPNSTESVIDRFGSPQGRFASPAGVAYESRALPYDPESLEYHRYEVLKPLPYMGGEAAPWFGEPGGAMQYRFEQSVEELVEQGYLKQLQ